MSDSHLNCDYFPPVIGILCMDIAQKLQQIYGSENLSYLNASYVKHLESAGARIIPIWNNRPLSYYNTIMNKINGILLPGGAINFNQKDCTKDLRNDSYLSSKYIYEIAEELNRNGEYFPVWGTCLGLQLMLTHSAGVEDVRENCLYMDVSVPVKFEDEKVLEESKLFANIDGGMKEKMSLQPFGCHRHKYCVTKKGLEKFKIDQKWRILTTNQDANDLQFISIVEHKDFPFFGSQIHPERIVHGYLGPQDNCHHCHDCLELGQYFAKFFVQQCSLNKNRFTNFEEELRHSIHNFPLTVPDPSRLLWQNCYLFKANVDYPKEIGDTIILEAEE